MSGNSTSKDHQRPTTPFIFYQRVLIDNVGSAHYWVEYMYELGLSIMIDISNQVYLLLQS